MKSQRIHTFQSSLQKKPEGTGKHVERKKKMCVSVCICVKNKEKRTNMMEEESKSEQKEFLKEIKKEEE